MKTILTRVGAGLLLFVVALLTASATLRLFIHGREVSVPNLSNLSDEDAEKAAAKLGLNLSVENRFYSAAVAPNHVLSQSPVAGSRVRRGWQVRVTESLGGQQVNVPDMTGQTERPAALVLRRLQLEVGTIARLPVAGPPGLVLTQSPPPNTTDLAGPRVGLLVSDDDSAASASAAYVMPALGGMTLFAANVRLARAGLHIASATDPTYVAPPVETPAVDAGVPGSATPATPATPDPAIPATIVAPPPVSGNATIISQSPAPGHRVSRADRIVVTAAVRVVTPDTGLPADGSKP